MICQVSNGHEVILSPNDLQTVYPDVRHREELIDCINTHGGPKEPYIPTSLFKCTLGQDKLAEEYMGVYTHWQMIINPIYGQISYNCSLPTAFKLKLGYNPRKNLVELKRVTGMEIAEHIIRPAKVTPASGVKVRCMQPLIFVHRVWNVLKRVEERREMRMVGNRMILVLM